MNPTRTHRLDGLQPDSLLGFLALLGLLRCLEEARPVWWPRVSWTVDAPPVRPALHVAEPVTAKDVATAAAEGLNRLAEHHRFIQKDLKLPRAVAASELRSAAQGGDYPAELWASLVSDAAPRDFADCKDGVRPTPLCLLFGQSHQHFLERLERVPNAATPPARGKGRKRLQVSETDCIAETLFAPWLRLDPITSSFRWDPAEDVRYAYRANDPTKAKTKATTQHGANRLAAIGASVLTVVPRRLGQDIGLVVRGGPRRGRGFTLEWPIWRDPVSLAGVKALLTHPRLNEPGVRSALGVTEVRRTRRISVAKNMNFSRAVPVPVRSAARTNVSRAGDAALAPRSRHQ